MGASLRFGTYEGGSTDIAVHYYATVRGTKIAARFAGWNTAGTSTTSDGGYGGSISALHSSGISLTFAGAGQGETRARADDPATVNVAEVDLEDPTNMWGRVGYQFKSLSFGKTHLSVNWQTTEDMNADDREVDIWGINIVQRFDAYGTEVYGGYANFDLDTGDNIDYEDIDAGWVGMRVKF